MAEVIFNKLEKVYSNGFKAVHGIDLKIADGEFMVIVGPSGCAKSTTLRMLAGLETISGGEVRIRISDLHKQLKKSGKPATTVYVTHDQTEAMTMGDRICVMKLGHIMQVDTPDNLYHQPKNMFVAGFIGAPEMNIRPSQLVEHGGRLHLTLGDQRLPLNDRLQSKVETHKNQQVFFGVRPEFVSLSDEPFAEGSCAGEMVRVENMGHEFFVYLRVADYELTARVPSDDAKPMIAKGLNRKVYFTFDLNKCHIFDAKTEQNLSL
ncbi:TPA: ABC transporter ATP-binding protein [Klebsiella pneumoniae]|nr:ABC transporter ATP-binding protein [Klebsiella pneumoniae]